MDADDFLIWSANKFSVGTDWRTGDFDGNGVTDVSDFNIWNANRNALGHSQVVPEPAAVLLAFAGILLLTKSGCLISGQDDMDGDDEGGVI